MGMEKNLFKIPHLFYYRKRSLKMKHMRFNVLNMLKFFFLHNV